MLLVRAAGEDGQHRGQFIQESGREVVVLESVQQWRGPKWSREDGENEGSRRSSIINAIRLTR